MTYEVTTFKELHQFLKEHKLISKEYYRMLIDLQPIIRLHISTTNQTITAKLLNISQSKLSIILKAIEPLLIHTQYSEGHTYIVDETEDNTNKYKLVTIDIKEV